MGKRDRCNSGGVSVRGWRGAYMAFKMELMHIKRRNFEGMRTATMSIVMAVIKGLGFRAHAGMSMVTAVDEGSRTQILNSAWISVFKPHG